MLRRTNGCAALRCSRLPTGSWRTAVQLLGTIVKPMPTDRAGQRRPAVAVADAPAPATLEHSGVLIHPNLPAFAHTAEVPSFTAAQPVQRSRWVYCYQQLVLPYAVILTDCRETVNSRNARMRSLGRTCAWV